MLFVALLPAAMIALALAFYFLVLRYADADAALHSRGSTLIRQLAPAAEYGAFAGNLAELRRLAMVATREPDVTAVVFYDRNGKQLAATGTTRLAENPSGLDDDWEGRSDDGAMLYFHRKIRPIPFSGEDPFSLSDGAPEVNQDLLGSVTLEMSRATVVARKYEILMVTALFTLLALAAGVLLAHRLGRDVTEPILALQATVALIHAGNLNARVTPHPASTLRTLEEGINEMAAALQEGRNHLQRRISAATAELREKKEEAERTSIAKSRFLAAASHDLRQPLHALSLFVTELEPQLTSGGQRRLAQQIATAASAMNTQFNAMLDVSRLDLSSVVPKREKMALAPLIERVAALHRHDAQARGLSLRFAPTRAWTESDPHLLERMLGNLVSNAVRYTRGGGILIGVRRKGEAWRLEVWDTGIGIEAVQLPLIFQEFYQIGNPERDASKGLGLGLAIVQRLAQMLDHRLEAASRPGRGSLFGILVPRIPLRADRRAKVRTTPGGISGFDAEVLVVDADRTVREQLCNLLEGWGCSVVGTDSLIQTDIFAGRPDVVIFDEHGYPPIADFLAGEPSREVILIFLGDAPDDRLFEKIKIHGKLSKPLRPARLKALLQHLLQPRVAETPTA